MRICFTCWPATAVLGSLLSKEAELTVVFVFLVLFLIVVLFELSYILELFGAS
jgi:hypothetical protein